MPIRSGGRYEPTDAGAVDWRQFLDLAEQIGGSKSIVDLYRRHVVTPGQEHDLDDPSGSARGLRPSCVARGGSNGQCPSAGPRRRMAEWMFVAAEVDIDDADDGARPP